MKKFTPPARSIVAASWLLSVVVGVATGGYSTNFSERRYQMKKFTFPTGSAIGAVWFFIALLIVFAVPSGGHAAETVKLQHRASGWCAVPMNLNAELSEIGLGECTDRTALFTLTNGRFKNNATGKCINFYFNNEKMPSPYNNSRLILRAEAGCLSPMFIFRMRDNGAMQWKMPNFYRIFREEKCIHPLGGRADSGKNTRLVMHDGCQGDRLAFDILRN